MLNKNQLLQQFQRGILPLQGINALSTDNDVFLGIPSTEEAFPYSTFPIGCIHEFICSLQTTISCWVW